LFGRATDATMHGLPVLIPAWRQMEHFNTEAQYRGWS
jgi:hypothetical protein